MRFWVWLRWDIAKPVGRRVLYALMLSAIASCCYGAASDPTIEVRGNRRVDAKAIREHFHAAPVALSAPSAINAALKELYATGLFEDVKIVTAGARLIVTVVEAPVIDRLRFEGNRQLKDKDLAKEISLKPGDPMTLLTAIAGLAIVTMCASSVPALRASRLEPTEALRDE